MLGVRVMRNSRRHLCDSGRLPKLLQATQSGHSVVWMAPCAKTLKPAVETQSSGSTFVFHDEVNADFFAGPNAPRLPSTIVVSAQAVNRSFMEAWREHCPQEQMLTLIRRGTSLGSICLDSAKELGIEVFNTPGVNSPHVAQFVVETLGLSKPLPGPSSAKAVVVGSGSVGQCVVDLMERVGVRPVVVNRSPTSPALAEALKGATHVAVCAATSSEPIFTAAHVEELLRGEERRSISVCSVSRPEAFSLDAIMMIAEHAFHDAHLRFDYGDSILAPTRDKVNEDGVKERITWSSKAMASEACKQDMDFAVLELLGR